MFVFSKDQVKKGLEKILEELRGNLSHIHTGQVSPALVENIKVQYQGFEMRLMEMTSIRIEGPRTLVIEPWDKNAVMDIERAILQEKRGIAPQIKGSLIFLSFPTITQETKMLLIKEIKKIEEEERIKIRQVRDEFWEKIKKAESQGEIRQDDKFKFKDQLQEVVDEYNKKLEEMAQSKIASLE